MDTGLSRGYSRGGRRGRGYRRGRFGGRGSRNHYFEPHQAQFNEGEEHYQEQYESSQKDDSYRNSTQHYNEHPRGRGRGRGRYRGGYRNDRGGYRNDRGGNRGSYRGKGRGGYPRVPPPLNEQTLDTRSKEFKPPQRIQHGEYERRENTSGSNPPICYVEPEDTKVYYQAEDFLKKYDGLPEKTEYLVKELCDGSIQCAICTNEIVQISAIWNCKTCYQPFHLGCIRKWIKKINSEGPISHMPYEDRKEEITAEDENNEGTKVGLRLDENGQVIIEATDLYNWSCPNCTHNYCDPMPKYNCYCGKDINPEHSSYRLPHSCNESCGKKKNKTCGHSRCNLECHPGACVPCEEFVTISCFCGKQTKQVTCQIRSQNTHYSCRDICGKMLGCYNHICEEDCHDGPCPPCQVKEKLACYCGKEEFEVECGVVGASCRRICGKPLDCGNHTCQKTCHKGACDECDLAPGKVKLCPCGKTLLKSMGASELRKSCLDDVPTCNSICGKRLPCGTHHCKSPCHQGPCNLCQVPLIDICVCGKGQRKKKCYELKYPIQEIAIFGEELMREIEDLREQPFRCVKKCSQIKSCKKHRCQAHCCPAERGNDPDGVHLCVNTCDKPLPCGIHNCSQFCHTGPCDPCSVYSNHPLSCACGATVIQPPVRCGEKPYCFRQCTKKHEACGHPCGQQCHPGPCPPCTQGVKKLCACGKIELESVKCGDQSPSCGQICDVKMPCGHHCRKMCHDHEKYMEEGEEQKCNAKCNRKRKNCDHKCQEKCHDDSECPDVPCDAEIKIYCKCKYRHIIGICNRFFEGYEEEEAKEIECNGECMKNKRDAQIAKAFAKKDEKKQKELKADYYPEILIDFATEHLKVVVKIERILEEVVRNKETKSLPEIEPGMRKYICNLAKEHYFLEVCTYGGRFKGQKKVTDVYYKDETTQVPATLLSEYVKLIKKGILSKDAEERKNKLFEASIKVGELPIGSSLEDIKRNLIGFHSEFYTEKIGIRGGFYLHFYNIYRAEEAYKKMRNSGAGYSNIDLIDHSKPAKKKSKKKKKKQMDLEGFMEV